MRYPQVIVCAFDAWAANQLRTLAAEHRWLLREVRQPAAALELVREPRPTVLVIQADPTAESPDPLRLLADAHRLAPDVAAVVLSDAKLPDDDRAAWAAAVLDLGARSVLFPPLQRPVLEDLVVGLMTATQRRTAGASSGTIDLSEERYKDD